MNWNQLQYVITVKEEKNITHAAEKLYISQPSLSLSIKALEKELGIELFERKNGELRLTDGGILFYEWAQATMQSHRQLLDKLDDLAGGKRQTVRMGISPHRSQLLMPQILEEFYRLCPECELKLTELPTTELKQLMERNELDFIIDTAHPDTMNFTSEVLVQEKILVGIPRTWMERIGGSEDGRIRLKQIVEAPVIMLGEDQVTGHLSRRLFENAGIVPKVRMECNSLENTMNLCRQQMGIAFGPELFAGLDYYNRDICFCEIADQECFRMVCLVYPSTRYQNQAMKILLELFRNIVPRLYDDIRASVPQQPGKEDDPNEE